MPIWLKCDYDIVRLPQCQLEIALVNQISLHLNTSSMTLSLPAVQHSSFLPPVHIEVFFRGECPLHASAACSIVLFQKETARAHALLYQPPARLCTLYLLRMRITTGLDSLRLTAISKARSKVLATLAWDCEKESADARRGKNGVQRQVRDGHWIAKSYQRLLFFDYSWEKAGL